MDKSNRFTRLYGDIRGKLLYDVLKWMFFAGGAAVTSYAIHFIQTVRKAPQQDLLGYIILGVLIFLSLALCFGITAILSRISINKTPTEVPVSPLANKEALNAAVREVKEHAARSVICQYMAKRAEELTFRMEGLRNHWDRAGEKLIHPLNVGDEITNRSSTGQGVQLTNSRNEFLLLYWHHLTTLKQELPDFKSKTVTAGYPSDHEYLEVRLNLIEHAEKLKSMAEQEWDGC